ncbi:MAG: hypothetical protein KF850_00290 [Labilithrix sp.]|nr:hypothetical protein [Labilithrix sp.]
MRRSPTPQIVFFAGLLVAASFACSGESNGAPAPGEPPPGDAGPDDDGDADAGPDADCPACRLYPAECSPGVLCRASIALDSKVLLAVGERAGVATAVGSHGTVVELVDGAWRDGGVGTNDALRSMAFRGDELWAASSLDALFIRSHGDGAAEWARLAPRQGNWSFFQNVPINGLVADPQRTWAWAAVTPVCAGGFNGDGVALVRMRREATAFQLESVVRNSASRCAGLNAVAGSGDALWAAGDLGAVYELTDLDTESPSTVAHNSGTTATLLAVWADATGHVWASGTDGALVHRLPGRVFAREEVPTSVAIHAVHGTSASDVWAVGADATAMHFDGETWSRVPIAGLGDRRPTLRAVTAVTRDRVLVAGDGVLLTLAGADGVAP